MSLGALSQFGVTVLTSEATFTTDSHSTYAVPEPETYAMLLAGLGLLAMVARRQRRSTTRNASLI